MPWCKKVKNDEKLKSRGGPALTTTPLCKKKWSFLTGDLEKSRVLETHRFSEALLYSGEFCGMHAHGLRNNNWRRSDVVIVQREHETDKNKILWVNSEDCSSDIGYTGHSSTPVLISSSLITAHRTDSMFPALPLYSVGEPARVSEWDI